MKKNKIIKGQSFKCHVKKDDIVCVITGKDKKKTGKILKVFPLKQKVIVDGINVISCFNKKKNKNNTKKNMPIHISNVAHIDPEKNVPTRVIKKRVENKIVLISKLTGKEIR